MIVNRKLFHFFQDITNYFIGLNARIKKPLHKKEETLVKTLVFLVLLSSIRLNKIYSA